MSPGPNGGTLGKKLKDRIRERRDAFAGLSFPVGRVTALYVHIPFCGSRCAYCGFVSSNRHSESDRDKYLDLLRREAGHLTEEGRFTGRTASMLYIGGGTPTVLSPDQLRRLIDWLTRLLPLDDDVEFTCEAHPGSLLGSLGQERLAALEEGGINRLSMGVQDFEPAVLRACGRSQTIADVEESLQRARSAGIKNINLDFIYGLPGQTPATWQRTLDRAITLQPEQLTAYRVRLKPGTPMAQRGPDEFPSEDASARMHERTLEAMAQAGYVHLLSNQFAVRGYMFYNQFALPECHYRYETDNYLPTRDTIGMGVSAYSTLKDRLRQNFVSRDAYDSAVTRNESAVENSVGFRTKQHQARMVVLGLRRPEIGVCQAEFRAYFGRDLCHEYRAILRKLFKQGLARSSAANLRLTRKGILNPDKVDEVCAALYASLTGDGEAERRALCRPNSEPAFRKRKPRTQFQKTTGREPS